MQATRVRLHFGPAVEWAVAAVFLLSTLGVASLIVRELRTAPPAAQPAPTPAPADSLAGRGARSSCIGAEPAARRRTADPCRGHARARGWDRAVATRQPDGRLSTGARSASGSREPTSTRARHSSSSSSLSSEPARPGSPRSICRRTTGAVRPAGQHQPLRSSPSPQRGPRDRGSPQPHRAACR